MLKPTRQSLFRAGERVTGLQRKYERGASLVTANDSGGRAVHLLAKTAWAISDWLKG